MDRLIPELHEIRLPEAISAVARAHLAGALADLVETMASMLSVATARKTGRLPSFRMASNDTITAICPGPPLSDPPPPSLVFDRRFVTKMLLVWDSHTQRDPEEAATYLRIDGNEYVVGIASRLLVDAIANKDADALRGLLTATERVVGVPHGGI